MRVAGLPGRARPDAGPGSGRQSLPEWHPYGKCAARGARRAPGRVGRPALLAVMAPVPGKPAGCTGMSSELGEMTCGELANVAAELALGALTGRERAQALAHLDACHACREAVLRLMTAADELPCLLPAGDPPPGFEAAVMTRVGLTDPGPLPAGGSRTSRRQTLAAAASVLAAVAAGAVGWSMHPRVPQAGPTVVSAALIAPGHRTVGMAFVYRESPGWVYVSVDDGPGSQPVTCQVAGLDGQVTTTGTFWLADGHAAWGGPAPDGPGWPASVRLVTAGGAVLAIASFTPR